MPASRVSEHRARRLQWIRGLRWKRGWWAAFTTDCGTLDLPGARLTGFRKRQWDERRLRCSAGGAEGGAAQRRGKQPAAVGCAWVFLSSRDPLRACNAPLVVLGGGRSVKARCYRRRAPRAERVSRAPTARRAERMGWSIAMHDTRRACENLRAGPSHCLP